ncbi:MAG: cytochrome c biogenesis CcdA family protein [Hyphomicrobiaceae bacterium]|nr:cytochrome c biogenesis protein CcdA [Hyphomicrobiaceae bacterium]
MSMDVSLALGVVLAGLVSFLSPCVLPLVPPYLAYLGGTTIERMSADGPFEPHIWRRVVVASLCFVAGFSTVFIGLGAGASAFGQLIQTYKQEMSMVAGVVIILFGLHFLGLLRISMFYSDLRFRKSDVENVSNIGAYVMGLAFAFGWTPCVGPVLATVLTLAANENSLRAGVYLLALYSLGLAIPFVAAAMAIKPFLSFMQKFRRHLGRVEKAMGAALVLTGIMFLFGWMNIGGQWLLDHFPQLALLEEWVAPKGLNAELLKKGAGK